MKKYCKDIESSIYVAPNEIRSCCQRFFYKGKMRGDTKLLDIKKNITPNAENIKKAREKLIEELQNDNVESCLGCPYIYTSREDKKITSEVKHLSIEHHTYCNLRCTYCSPIYYGGKKPMYNVVDFIKHLSRDGSFQNCKQVVWGGGEPTLDKTFELIVKEIDKQADPTLYHRVFTNSVRFHPAVLKFLQKGLIKIVTSVDAGTPETFKKVRGRDKFEELFKNLKLYARQNPSSVTIKYILTDDNLSLKELSNFVNKCKSSQLIDCCFQISMNYKKDKISLDYLKSILALMSYFNKNKINKYFCDDHIASRFKKLNLQEKEEISQFIKINKIDDVVLKANKEEVINIFGAGDIAENIISKSFDQNEKQFVNLFDSDESKTGKILSGIKIKHSREILQNGNKIFISAAQGYDDVIKYLEKNNVDKNRIISGIFL